MIDHLRFNAANYYPLNLSSDSITVDNRTFKEYKFQKYSTQLNNIGTDKFTLIDDYHKLDMNRFTVVTFDNGDGFKTENYELYRKMASPSNLVSQGRTNQGNLFIISTGITQSHTENSIFVNYESEYYDSENYAHLTPIDVKWCRIEINVD